MKFSILCLSLLISLPLLAQKNPSPEPQATIGFATQKPTANPWIKMECDPASTLEIIRCDGENRDDPTGTNLGDNDPSDGAYMIWEAQGGNSGLYYNQIIQDGNTIPIGMQGTTNNIFTEDANGVMDVNLFIGGGSINSCLDPGVWTIRVWDVLDDNGDGQPDRDANGDIIGCYVECTLTFLPSCPAQPSFTAVASPVGCTNLGSITIDDLDVNDVYCDGQSDFTWTGPNGFTANSLNISGLEAGDYTFVLNDFYGCESNPVTVTVEVADPVEIACGSPEAPSVFGASDGSFQIDILQGTGDYTVEWTGPESGSQQSTDDNILIFGLPAGTYTVTVTDDNTGCTDECTITIPDPPCEIAFTVEEDNLGSILITVTSGQSPFYVLFDGPTSTQNDLGPYIENMITLSPNLFEAGNYTFTVYEGNRPDCDATVDFVVPGPDCTDFAISETLTQPTCGQSNGGIAVTLTGGNGNLSITWISGPGIDASNQNNLTLTDLAAGTYAYQAFDEEGCALEGDYQLSGADPIVFDCGAVDETCPDGGGNIGISLSGGTTPFTLSYTVLDPDGNFLDSQTGITVADGDSLFALPAGSYTINITDGAGCSSGCSTVIQEFTCPVLPGNDQSIQLDSVIDATVVGGTGGIIVSLGGTPDWTYQVISTTGGQNITTVTDVTPDTLLGLQIDTYNLYLIPPETNIVFPSCCSPVDTLGPFQFIVRGPACDMVVSVGSQNASCFGADDGTVTVTVDNANGTPVIIWTDPGLNGFSLSGLPPGDYDATVTDDSGCGVPVSVTITQPPQLLVSITELNAISCGGDNDGILEAETLNAQGDVSYFWDIPGAPDDAIQADLPSGQYTVQIVDAQGCTATDTYFLDEPAPVDLSCSAEAETGIGLNDGMVSFTLSGGTGAYTFTLNGSAVARPTDDTFTGLPPGTYTITVSDELGCIGECSTVVNQGGCGEFILSFLTEQPDCDDANGSTVVVPEGNNGTVTFAWAHGPATALLTDLAPDTYTVTATDAFGCQAVETVTIESFDDFPTVTLGEFLTTCADGCAELTYSVSGPAPVRLFYTVDQAGTQVQGFVDGSGGAEQLSLCPADLGFPEWDNTTVTFDSLVAANGCARPVAESRDISVFAPAPGSLQPLICVTDTFRLNGVAFFAAAPSGDVILEGFSANGCDSIVTVTLDFFAPALGSIAPVICAADTFRLGGEAFHAGRTAGDVTLPGASANGCDSTVTITLGFFEGAVGSLEPVICATDTFRLNGEAFHGGRPAGTVVLDVVSANGCDSTVNVSVSFFEPALGSTAPVICATDTFRLNGEAFHAGRTTGDVVLAGASANGCDSTVSVSVSFFAPAVGVLAPVICATDTFRYEGVAFHAGFTAGDVVLEGASTNGCDSTVSVSVSFFEPAIGSVDPVVCATDTFRLGGEAFHAGRTTGDVVLEGASANGCDSTVSVSLAFFAAAVSSLEPTVCAGDTFFLHGIAFHENFLADDVVLVGASANGCDSTIAVNVTLLAPAFAPLDSTICAADTVFVGTEAFHFSRPTGDVTLENQAANGCDSTVQVSLSFFPQLTGLLDTTICTGTSFVYAGRVFDAAVDDEVVVLDAPSANGCDSLVSVTVRLRDVPNVSISGDGVTCDDGILNISITYDGPAEANVVLSSNPAETISLVSGTTTIQRPVPVGTLVTILSAEDGGPCPLVTSGSITVTMTDLTAAIEVMSGDGVFAVSCSGGSDGQVIAVTSGGVGPFTFDWNTGDNTEMVDSLPVGDVSLIVTSGRGCQRTARASLSSPDTMVVQVGRLEATCLSPNPALIIRSVQGGIEPYLVAPPGQDVFQPLGATPDTIPGLVGTTTLLLQDANGCLLRQSFEFASAPTGSVEVTPTQAYIFRGDSVEVTVLTDLDAAGVLLVPGPEELISGIDFFVRPDSTTTYTVTAVDAEGCTASADLLVVVDQHVPVYAPTAFSPNEDGTNDRFRVYGGRNVMSFSDFAIFDRWGNRVYDLAGPIAPDDVNWGWDGKASDGRLRQSSVYVFSITVTYIDGRTQVVKGDLVLNR